MRFIDAKGKDIIPRKDRVWTPAATAMRMAEALEAVEQVVPDYLRTVAWSDSLGDLQTAAFSMRDSTLIQQWLSPSQIKSLSPSSNQNI